VGTACWCINGMLSMQGSTTSIRAVGNHMYGAEAAAARVDQVCVSV
jgi:hypothetical protein